MSSARLDVWARAQIVAFHKAGCSTDTIVKKVRKKDGKRPKIRSVRKTIAKHKAMPSWRGEDSSAGGRPRALTEKEHKELTRLVFRERGQHKVTVAYCKKRLPFLRRVNNSTVERALHRAGLTWLRRCEKRFVPPAWKVVRLRYCRWLVLMAQAFLNNFAYTDGTSFYLARCDSEQEDKNRRRLGPFVWRMSNRKDGLWDDNVGPSLYAKAQGYPVKIWGFFANGRLEYWALPEAENGRKAHMTIERYADLVEAKFSQWRQACFGDNRSVHLVQDGERCLWADDSLAALAAARCHPVTKHPKYSPDFNAIENVWHRVRQRLDETAPATLETRPEFLVRLRRTVTWLNTNCREELVHLARNQKERATAVQKLKGARCKF
jgi:transposase